MNLETSVETLLIFAIFLYIGVRGEEDPCQSYRTFPKTFLGSRNERCPVPSTPVCDYYLPEDWYAIDGGQVLTNCPSGDCGVSFPGWMNGSLPFERDGIVDRTICIKRSTDCCSDTVAIKVKRCKGFHIFYLKSFESCPSGYCFESSVSCGQPTPEPQKPVVDPCKTNSVFPRRNFGSRNERCQTNPVPVCDYYLREDWYSVDEGTLTTQCPSGMCGVGFPVWLNGTLPIAADGIVKRKACIKDGSKCCFNTVTVQIKACDKAYVYHLPALSSCPSAYCFESSKPCISPTTIPTTENTDYTAAHGDSLLIAITVTTTLVLAIVVTISAVLIKHKWKRVGPTPNVGGNGGNLQQPSCTQEPPPEYAKRDPSLAARYSKGSEEA